MLHVVLIFMLSLSMTYLVRLWLVHFVVFLVLIIWHLKVDLHLDAPAAHLKAVICLLPLGNDRLRRRRLLDLLLSSLPLLVSPLTPFPYFFGLSVLLIDLFLHPLERHFLLLLPVHLLIGLVLGQLCRLLQNLLGPLVYVLLCLGRLVLLYQPLFPLLFFSSFLLSFGSFLLSMEFFLDLLIIFLHNLQLIQLLRDHGGLWHKHGPAIGGVLL